MTLPLDGCVIVPPLGPQSTAGTLLSDEQKRAKVHNLMQELRRAGRIERIGSLEGAQWILGSNPEGFTRDDPATEA